MRRDAPRSLRPPVCIGETPPAAGPGSPAGAAPAGADGDGGRLPGIAPEGEIGLQRHGSPIEFRSIYLKEGIAATGQTGEPPARLDDRAQAVIEALERDCVKRRIRLLAPEKARRLTELLHQARPQVVVECGTAVGYSGLWIARELKAAGRGKLITIEIVARLSREAEANLRKAGLAEYVDFRVGDGAIVVADNVGYGAREMAEYLKHVRSKYRSTTEWFDIDLPWAKRDAIEVTIISPRDPGGRH